MSTRFVEALLDASIQGALGVIAVFVLVRSCAWLSHNARSILWFLAIAKFVIALLFIVEIPLLVSQESMSQAQRIAPINYTWQQWSWLLALLWAIGFLVVLSNGALAHNRILKLASQARSVASLSRTYGVIVKVHPEVPAPLVFGVLRPVVLLPATIVAESHEREIDLVLRHELFHLKRMDGLLALFVFFCRACFFFHPAMWLAKKEWDSATEAACDQYAMESANASITEYSQILIRLTSPKSAVGALSAAPSFRTLENRIRNMNMQRNKSKAGSIALTILVITAVASAVPMVLTRSKDSGTPKPKSQSSKTQATSRFSFASSDEPTVAAVTSEQLAPQPVNDGPTAVQIRGGDVTVTDHEIKVNRGKISLEGDLYVITEDPKASAKVVPPIGSKK